MGDYAEMMLDGTCCCNCGEYLGDGDGFATYCASCKPEEDKVLTPAKQKVTKPRKSVLCAHTGCGRRFVDENAMKMHMRTFHIDKDALREKQEKDKKLNAIRNAAPALLEALENMVKMWDDIYPDMKSRKYPQERLEDAEFNEVLKARSAIAAARQVI